MLQFSDLTIGAAVANRSGAMDARDHFKNGASSKSHTSRRNFLRKVYFILLVAVFICNGCDKKDDTKNNILKETSWQYIREYAGGGNSVGFFWRGEYTYTYTFLNETDVLWEIIDKYAQSTSGLPRKEDMKLREQRTAVYSYRGKYPNIEIITSGDNPSTFYCTIENNQMKLRESLDSENYTIYVRVK